MDPCREWNFGRARRMEEAAEQTMSRNSIETSMPRILIVEDDAQLAAELERHLAKAQWITDRVGNLGDALEAIMQRNYRVVLLDRGLPDGDGISLIGAIRARRPAPAVIVVTARDLVPDRVRGLDAGADDYLIKPFSADELIARVRVAARRPQVETALPAIRLGALSFQPGTREVAVKGRNRIIPRRELALLELLIERSGRVVLRDYLDDAIFSADDAVTSNALDTQVSRLRKRLTDWDSGVQIRTVRGVGYILCEC